MAPSTQPPDTLPPTSWPAVADTAIAAPGSRGALRYVRTTVARPKGSPAAHHLVIGLRMSRTLCHLSCQIPATLTAVIGIHYPGLSHPLMGAGSPGKPLGSLRYLDENAGFHDVGRQLGDRADDRTLDRLGGRERRLRQVQGVAPR